MTPQTARPGGLAARLASALAPHWWANRPTLLSKALLPLAWLYGWLATCARARSGPAQPLPVPLLIVGNVIVGGAGKTPTVIALVQAFQVAGRHPGVVSRGHGRRDDGVCAVQPSHTAADVGDEPLLIQRRTGVPVWVGRQRSAAARALCAAHPEVDVLIADDGLQHHALARDAELLVFDQRGIGNGLLLPAGPLREQPPAGLAAHQRVLYTGGVASTPLPGGIARRALGRAWPLSAWSTGDASQCVDLISLRGLPLLAAAGLAAPQKFFAMLTEAGLAFRSLALPDHHDFATLPWPADTPHVLVTEKDAVKLRHLPAASGCVWVLPLDFALPDGLATDLLTLLPKPASPSAWQH